MHSEQSTPGPERAGHGHVLIAGASGVIGAAALEAFARLPGWQVSALSRRRPVVSAGLAFRHVAADLEDDVQCARLVAALPQVSHLVYAAVAEAPGLVSGWQDAAMIARNGAMLRNLLAPLAARGGLDHVSILQGGKAYGAHLHPVTVPLRESQPRDDHANFYWLHEDDTRALAAQHGFGYTVWRPQIVLGCAPGAAMNPVAAIGAYAAICRARGLAFALPGAAETLWQVVDADLFAQALVWAAASPAARGETFNFTNGDLFVLRHAWPHLAGALGLGCEGEPPESFAAIFSARENRAAWRELARDEGLAIADLDALLGQSHHYLDLLTSARIADKPVPMIVSTIKLRQAGFGACIDSFTALQRQLARMVALGLLPAACSGDAVPLQG
jgi:nucleoside-diphosphate-sugar epimerase